MHPSTLMTNEGRHDVGNADHLWQAKLLPSIYAYAVESGRTKMAVAVASTPRRGYRELIPENVFALIVLIEGGIMTSSVTQPPLTLSCAGFTGSRAHASPGA